MMKNYKLARLIADLGVFELKSQLEYKCKLSGSELAIISRWYPSSKSCYNCGHQQDLTLADRVDKCENCGSIQKRYENTAIKIKNEGLIILKLSLLSIVAYGRSACGWYRIADRVKQEENSKTI